MASKNFDSSTRCRLKAVNPDGSNIDMIADKGFVSILHDFDQAFKTNDDDAVEALCRGIRSHPNYARAFEFMLEREPDENRKIFIERILTEFEFLSVFDLFDEESR